MLHASITDWTSPAPLTAVAALLTPEQFKEWFAEKANADAFPDYHDNEVRRLAHPFLPVRVEDGWEAYNAAYDRFQLQVFHSYAIALTANHYGLPVNAAAAEAYTIKLPSHYVKKYENFVSQ